MVEKYFVLVKNSEIKGVYENNDFILEQDVEVKEVGFGGLFELPELLSDEVIELLDEYSDGSLNYQDCENLLVKLKPHNLTFEYDLSAEPYGLKLINQ